jgi:nicotinamidase-related amidase
MAEDKRVIYQRSGLGHRIGYGKHPALLVIDMQLGFTAPERSPLAGNLDGQIAAINRLIPAARMSGTPIVFTVVGYDPKIPGDGGLWPEKAPTLLELKLGSELVELDPRGSTARWKIYCSSRSMRPLSSARPWPLRSCRAGLIPLW